MMETTEEEKKAQKQINNHISFELSICDLVYILRDSDRSIPINRNFWFVSFLHILIGSIDYAFCRGFFRKRLHFTCSPTLFLIFSPAVSITMNLGLSVRLSAYQFDWQCAWIWVFKWLWPFCHLFVPLPPRWLAETDELCFFLPENTDSVTHCILSLSYVYKKTKQKNAVDKNWRFLLFRSNTVLQHLHFFCTHTHRTEQRNTG